MNTTTSRRRGRYPDPRAARVHREVRRLRDSGHANRGIAHAVRELNAADVAHALEQQDTPFGALCRSQALTSGGETREAWVTLAAATPAAIKRQLATLGIVVFPRGEREPRQAQPWQRDPAHTGRRLFCAGKRYTVRTLALIEGSDDGPYQTAVKCNLEAALDELKQQLAAVSDGAPLAGEAAAVLERLERTPLELLAQRGFDAPLGGGYARVKPAA